ncbi:MAG: T9SS type A sorting domain-containing protein [Candidatus Cloacimonetes bacterium]|nr:T9SS type A sorting domain-containing protein [Candidatus Cloacimonadota bacterium]
MKPVVLLCAMLCCAMLSGQYTLVDTNLPDLSASYISWADLDKDGVYDLLFGGEEDYMPSILYNRIYLSNGQGNFTDLSAGFLPYQMATTAWADFDRDGFLDFVIMGYAGAGTSPLQVYRNNGNYTFSIAFSSPFGAFNGSIDTGDYDGDGDEDILLCGGIDITGYTRILRNDGIDSFVNISHPLPQVKYGAAKWVDYDLDGDLDISICGETNSAPWRTTKLFVNTRGVYTDSGLNFPALNNSLWEWTDLNNDRYPDFLLSGNNGSAPRTYLYLNSAGLGFSSLTHNLPNLDHAEATWGDLNLDGSPDLVIHGYNGSAFMGRLFHNLALGIYAEIDVPGHMDLLTNGDITMVDFDADADLDFFYSGWIDGWQDEDCALYQNNIAATNAVPEPPTAINLSVGEKLTFNWTGATDAETHGNALSYRMMMGTSPGAYDVISPGSDYETGYSYLPLAGKLSNKLVLWNIPSGTYYYCVQAIDGSRVASPWSAIQNFSCLAPGSPWTGNVPFSVSSSASSAYMLINEVGLSDPSLPLQPDGFGSAEAYALKLTADSGTASLNLELGTGIWNAYVYHHGSWTPALGNPFNVETGTASLSLPQFGFGAKSEAFVLVGRDENTLPVELTDFFGAQLQSGGVMLSWTWLGDVPLLGYRVYRAEVNDPAVALMLTPVLIPAQNSPEPEHYTFSDSEVEIPGAYYYWLEAQYHSHASLFGPAYVTLDEPEGDLLPQVFSISKAYPNPFRQQTLIDLEVKEGHRGYLSIYNLKGQKVFTRLYNAGSHKVTWQGKDMQNKHCAPGVYIYRFSSESYNQSGKMLYLGD